MEIHPYQDSSTYYYIKITRNCNHFLLDFGSQFKVYTHSASLSAGTCRIFVSLFVASDEKFSSRSLDLILGRLDFEA